MKIISAVFIGIACSLMVNLTANATEKMYGLASAGYSDLQFSQLDTDRANYKLALGHQFAPQWYVEVGYQQLIDDLKADSGIKADALYLAVLGKAGSREGELFYRLGVMNVDLQGIEPAHENGCAYGTNSEASPFCTFDEGVIAGVVGLGFDYHLGLNTMLRIEAEHIRGEKDFKVNIINMGFRYNFN